MVNEIVDLEEMNMKKRVISALVILSLLIPVVYFGGIVYTITLYAISLLALREFIKVKETRKEIPPLIKLISYIAISFLVLFNSGGETLVYTIDYRIVAGLFFLFLIPTVLYHNRSIYSITDAFYLIGGIFFLGIAFQLLLLIRNIDLKLFIYLSIICIFTDTFAYITGFLIGRNKLLEEISPNKTWEGLIGGTLFGVFIGTVFFHTAINPNYSIYQLIMITLFLSLLGQFGDLTFSAIKRYFGKKDFSNLIPGHGGVLDRLDSFIFVVLGFVFFFTIL